MNKKTRIGLAVAAALLSPFAVANAIKGTVVNVQGEPVSGAEVRIEGSKQVTYTNEKGQYQFKDVAIKHIHLHVYSAQYVHGDNDIGNIEGDRVIDFTLAPVSVENIVVTASVLGSSVLESVTPVTVIGQDELRKRQAETLGETLKKTAGVHSTYFGPVASSPIIRGNDGPRVKIVQNSLDVSDVSRIGPDHNVAANSTSATQVEVLRGPATLQYGSGAIGGVVNVVDQRIPRDVPTQLEGEIEVNYATVNDGKFGRFNLNGGERNIAFHIDGFKRKTDNADIPGFASVEPDEDEQAGVLENSQMDTTNITAGLSLIDEEGYIGFSVEKLDNLYGVPGHHHHHEDDHDEHDYETDDHDDDNHEEEHGEEGTVLDVDMIRYQASGEWYSPVAGISSVKFAAAHTDYEHVELEGDEVGTQFTNDSTELRLSAHHNDIQGWHGVLGLQYQHSDYAADGDEAFTPPTETQSAALFLIEQKKVGAAVFELGGRIEVTEYDASDTEFELEAAMVDHEDDHGDEHHDDEHHDEADHDDDHDHEHDHTFAFDTYRFVSSSLSAGVNWAYAPGYSVAVTLSRNERAPSQQELFSAGQHLATQTFEVGLVFDLDEDGEVADTLRPVQEEVSTNIDLTLRKFSGNGGYTISFFYNDVSDYIFQSATDLIALDDHDEHSDAEDDAHMDEAHDDHAHEEDGVPVYYFQQADATLYGVEAEGFYDITDSLRVTLFGDYIRAKIDTEDLPRIPPLRVGSAIRYRQDSVSADVSLVWYDEQDKVAPNETATDGYTLLDASVEYTIPGAYEWSVYARANNLLDEEARVHTSFIKDQAPLPGRNVVVGTRLIF